MRHILLLLALVAPPVLAQDGFDELFVRHARAGTLLRHDASREFQQRGWGTRYRDAVAERFAGTSTGDVRLEIALRPDYVPQVRRKLALEYRLVNNSDTPGSVTVSGSCGTVHHAVFKVIDPQGRLLDGYGRGLVGGPHCFCSQREVPFPARSAVRLETQTDSNRVMTWSPPAPGRYVIIGEYAVAATVRTGLPILSKPLVLDAPAP